MVDPWAPSTSIHYLDWCMSILFGWLCGWSCMCLDVYSKPNLCWKLRFGFKCNPSVLHQTLIPNLNFLDSYSFSNTSLCQSVHPLTEIGCFCSRNTAISITASPSPHPLSCEGEFTCTVRSYGCGGSDRYRTHQAPRDNDDGRACRTERRGTTIRRRRRRKNSGRSACCPYPAHAACCTMPIQSLAPLVTASLTLDRHRGGRGGVGDCGGGGDNPLWNKMLPPPRLSSSLSSSTMLQAPSSLSGGMKRMLATKYRMPSRVMPSHPEEKRWRLGVNGLVECQEPPQPEDLERRYYGRGRGGGGGGCGGGGGTTDGGGGDIIDGTTTTMDTNVATIAAGTTPRGEGGGGGGGGVIGRAIEDMRRLRPLSWPSPSSTSAVVNVGHCPGRRLVGHCPGRLHC